MNQLHQPACLVVDALRVRASQAQNSIDAPTILGPP
jgi:hypothetical protein